MIKYRSWCLDHVLIAFIDPMLITLWSHFDRILISKWEFAQLLEMCNARVQNPNNNLTNVFWRWKCDQKVAHLKIQRIWSHFEINMQSKCDQHAIQMRKIKILDGKNSTQIMLLWNVNFLRMATWANFYFEKSAFSI